MSRTRIALANAALIVVPFLLVELVVRAAAFVHYDFNPYYLTYGFKSPGMGLTTNAVLHDGYFKFKEKSVVTQGPVAELRIPSQINNIGLRGTRDVQREKAPDTVRIVTLGGSSTFGYHARDSHTYSALLEMKLTERLDGRAVEVINGGVPNFVTDHIVALLENELLAYQPDVITVYSAYNDAVSIMDAKWWQKLSRWLYDRVATYVALGRLMERVSEATVYSKWTRHAASPSAEYVHQQIDLHVEKYERNLRRILELGREAGATVVLIRQPIAGGFRADATRPDYGESARMEREKLESGAPMNARTVLMLVHSALLDIVDRLGAEHSVPVVDNVSIVDARKDRLLTYVHLSEEGNGALANAIVERLVPVLSP